MTGHRVIGMAKECFATFGGNADCLGNKLIYRNAAIASHDAPIHRRRRLGGMLNFYYREAA